MAHDVIVIGVGAMGSAAAYHLARRGAKVLALEQFDIPHTKGSSHGFSRMIRSAYYEHPNYVPLLRRAWELWHKLEDDTLMKLLHTTGGIYMGPGDSPAIAGSRRAARDHDLPHESLTHDELRQQFPQFRLPQHFVGLYEHQAGYVVPERAICAHADLAMRHGAEIHGNEPVIEWSTDEKGASVTTTRDTYRAEQLVFASGAWTDKLLVDLGVKLTVTRQVMGWVQPNVREPFVLGRFPVWAIDSADGGVYYGFPLTSEQAGLKLAHHHPGELADPDTILREPMPTDEQDFRPALEQYIPDANGPLLSMRICMYTNSPDHHFILDRHPTRPRVTFAAGFSGHGFKFASVIGEALADLAMKGSSELAIGFLGLGRLARST